MLVYADNPQMDMDTSVSAMSNDNSPTALYQPSPSELSSQAAHFEPRPNSSSVPGNAALIDLSKRRNWPAKLVDELPSLFYILDVNGRIKYVSPGITALTQHRPEELQDLFLKDFIHPDDIGVFLSELNECIISRCPMRMFYRLRRGNGTYVILQSIGHAHFAAARFAPVQHDQSPFCQAIFLTAIQYPSKNIGLLDTFLQHKMENVWLRKRIATLREEEARLDQAQQPQIDQVDMMDLGFDPGHDEADNVSYSLHSTFGQPIQSKRLQLGRNVSEQSDDGTGRLSWAASSVHENIEDTVDDANTHLLLDQMVQCGVDVSQIDPIEMFTGLRYQEGEQGHDVVTGISERKRKPKKITGDNVCTDCGTFQSPEWRKGPGGPKTLCNACGLRWAKREKKLISEANATPAQLAQLMRESSWAATIV